MMVWVLFSTFIIVGCFKFMNNKREQREHSNQKQLSKEGDIEQSVVANWSNLPDNILGVILDRLSFCDFLRFGGVCTSWRRVVTESIIYRSVSPLPSLPHLLVYHFNILNDMKAGFFCLKDQSLHHPKTPLFTGDMHCLGSVQGWLIMLDVNQIRSSSSSAIRQSPSFYFWNPISDDRVMLPSTLNIPYFIRWNILFFKVKASSEPDRPDCQVAGLLSGGLRIAFCRPGDQSWSIISIMNNDMDMIFSDIELVHGKCYALTELKTLGKLNSILVYDLGDPSPLQPKITIGLQHQTHYSPRECMWLSRDFKNVHLTNHIYYFLASNLISGDLYLIFMIVDITIYHYFDSQGYVERSVHTSPPVEKEFLVYKVVLSDEVKPQVVRVHSLRGDILFLSDKGSKIVPSFELTGLEDLIRGNTIYFAHAYPYKENPPPTPQVVKFCLTDGIITHIPLPGSELDPVARCLWFTPTI